MSASTCNLFHRCGQWVDGRTCRTPKGDAELVAEIREQIAELPSYGYAVLRLG